MSNLPKRNILFLFSDEHNRRFSGPYGDSRIRTPVQDRLARDGVVYDHAYTPSPLCFPARSAMVAGRWSRDLSVYNNCRIGSESETDTYGGLLAEAGVYTVHSGKCDWHIDPERAGYSRILVGKNRSFPGDGCIGRQAPLVREGTEKRAQGYGPRDIPHGGDVKATDHAVEWLREESAEIQAPWFLEVHLVAPHFPHYATPDLWEEYADCTTLPELGPEEPSAQHPRAADLRSWFQTSRFSEEDKRGLRRGYYGGVEWMDRQCARLIEALEATGQLEDTLIIYSSDHGEMLGKYGLWWKCSLYEDSVGIPLIMSGPGVSGGVRASTPVTLLDLQATFFDYWGIPMPSHRVGESLLRLPEDDPERVVFSEYHGAGAQHSSFMVRRGPWKLIYHFEAPHQLFHLGEDPEERVNRAESEPGILQELIGELRRQCDPEAENRRAADLTARQLSELERLSS